MALEVVGSIPVIRPMRKQPLQCRQHQGLFAWRLTYQCQLYAVHYFVNHAPVAQWIEQETSKLLAVGSIPTRGAI